MENQNVNSEKEEKKEPQTDSSAAPKKEDEKPQDSIKDAKARWDTESPATPGQPNRIDPKPENEDISPEPLKESEEYPEDDVDPEENKNIK